VSYSQGIAVAGGYGSGTYTFCVDAGIPPSGLQLNSYSGVIYGTPTTADCQLHCAGTSQSGSAPALTAYVTSLLTSAPHR